MSKDDAPPEHKRRTSLFHSLKKGMFSGNEKTIDPAYESARVDFQRLNDYVYKIKQAVANFSASSKALLNSSKGVCDGFESALEDAPRPHAYVQMLRELKATRLDLVSDRGEGALALSLDGTVNKKLDAELELHKALNLRIAEREELRRELDYYTKKVSDLRSERDTRQAKGKDEKPDQIEKFERNTKKLESIKQAFTAFNDVLISDLQERWTIRVKTLGPIMSDFVAAERQLLVLYATAVKDVASVDISRSINEADFSAAAAGTRREVNKAVDAANDARAQVVQRANSLANSSPLAAASAASAAAAAFNSNSPSRQPGPPPPPPPVPVASAASSNPFAAQFDFDDEFKMVGHDSSHQARDIFKKSTSPSNSSSSPQNDPWAQPPMLSAIQSSGAGVGAVSAAAFSMNTDGSFPSSSGHTPSPAPPPPTGPAYYGGAPGGAPTLPAGGRPRMDSFGSLANRSPPPRGEGQPSLSKEPKKSFNPFD